MYKKILVNNKNSMGIFRTCGDGTHETDGWIHSKCIVDHTSNNDTLTDTFSCSGDYEVVDNTCQLKAAARTAIQGTCSGDYEMVDNTCQLTAAARTAIRESSCTAPGYELKDSTCYNCTLPSFDGNWTVKLTNLDTFEVFNKTRACFGQSSWMNAIDPSTGMKNAEGGPYYELDSRCSTYISCS